MTQPAEYHDTDPAPGGNGQDDGYPCAQHAAELAETRVVLKDVADGMRAIVGRLDRIESMIGEPPDPSTGKPGRGMRGQIAAAVNAATRAGIRRELPSLVDDEESEITRVMDRPTLVQSKRAAEHDAAKARQALKVAQIKTWGGVIVGVIGALATAAAYLIPLVRG